MSSAEWLFLAISARFGAFFLLSPLFAQKNIPLYVRIGLTLLTSFLIYPHLLEMKITPSYLIVFQEFIIGYLLGLLLALFFEAALLAGQMIGVAAGFSGTEIFDAKSEKNALFAPFFTIIFSLLFLAQDLHHVLLRLFFESYTLLPLQIDFASLPLTLVLSYGKIFAHAAEYALFPLLYFSLIIVLLALLARFIPDIPLFWTAFPLQILLGFMALSFSLYFFNEILIKAFYEIVTFAKKFFFAWVFCTL